MLYVETNIIRQVKEELSVTVKSLVSGNGRDEVHMH